jgi:hypothetical protein
MLAACTQCMMARESTAIAMTVKYLSASIALLSQGEFG